MKRQSHLDKTLPLQYIVPGASHEVLIGWGGGRIEHRRRKREDGDASPQSKNQRGTSTQKIYFSTFFLTHENEVFSQHFQNK